MKKILIAAFMATSQFVWAQPDPLKSFELIVARCQAAFDSRPSHEVAFNERNKKWSTRLYFPTKISYDVKRTDSLVSPYTAVLKISEMVFAESAETQEAVTQMSVSADSSSGLSSQSTVDFAMQGSKWVAKGWNEQSSLKLRSEKDFKELAMLKRSLDDISKLQGPRRACLP